MYAESLPFKPKYTITDTILNNLTAIAAAREVIEQASLIPKWEAKLRRQAMLHNTHSSTAIEGNKLTLSQVQDLSQGRNVHAARKDKQEVFNYINALEKIPDFASAGEISVGLLLEIHKLITAQTLENASDSGVLRNRQVYVGKHVFDATGFHQEIVYLPPKTDKVPELVNEFITWLNLALEKKEVINPVLLAGIAHYEIARIHPFVDGNGRTARLLATPILYLSGFDHRRIFALDDFYDRDRQGYYAALGTVDKETLDITKWLEYFTEGVAASVNEAKEAVLRLGVKGKKGSNPQVALTAKQMKIIEQINSRGKVTNRDLQTIFNISAQAVHKELAKLVEMKVIKSQGQGRSLSYIMS